LRSFYVSYLTDLETNYVERAKYWWLKPDPGKRYEGNTEDEARWNEQRRLERLSLPNFGDLRSIPFVKLLLEEEDAHLTFTKSKWDSVREILPDEATKLYHEMLDGCKSVIDELCASKGTTDTAGVPRARLVSIPQKPPVKNKGKAKATVPEEFSDENPDFVPKALRASSFFNCKRDTLCGSTSIVKPFPDVLGGRHFCGISGEQAIELWLHFHDDDHLMDLEVNGNDGNNVPEPLWASWVRYSPRCEPWKKESLTCSVQAVAVAEALLAEMGLRSELTRMDDVVRLGKVFECARCIRGEPMSWVELVRTEYMSQMLSVS
jgi:hypothetical protein